MKYKQFKEIMDRYFTDDMEIYPHAWGGAVTFYDLSHGQQTFAIRLANGEWVVVNVKTGEVR